MAPVNISPFIRLYLYSVRCRVIYFVSVLWLIPPAGQIMTGSGSILWKLILSLIQMSRGKQWFFFLKYIF